MSRRIFRRLAVFLGATSHYAGIQGTYWVSSCCMSGFITVFMLFYGVSIQQVGVVVAIINSLAVLMQIGTANIVSRGRKLTLKNAIFILSASSSAMALAVFLTLGHSRSLMVTLFSACCILTVSVQPLLTSLAMEYINRGYALDFSSARGFGSMSYAAASFILGKLIARFGPSFLPIVHILFAVAVIALVALFKIPPHRAAVTNTLLPAEADKPEAESGLAGFARRNGRFLIMLGGVMCLVFCARVVFTYLIKIIESIGGDSSHMGTAIAIGALVEFPVMLYYTRLRIKFGCTNLFRLSAIFYTVKAAAVVFSGSIAMLYMANLLQIFSFALFFPSFTFYINHIMDERDRVRGQAVGMAAMTAGDVLGALMCGIIPASVPMRTVLYTGLLVSALGSIFLQFAVRRIDYPGGRFIEEPPEQA